MRMGTTGIRRVWCRRTPHFHQPGRSVHNSKRRTAGTSSFVRIIRNHAILGIGKDNVAVGGSCLLAERGCRWGWEARGRAGVRCRTCRSTAATHGAHVPKPDVHVFPLSCRRAPRGHGPLIPSFNVVGEAQTLTTLTLALKDVLAWVARGHHPRLGARKRIEIRDGISASKSGFCGPDTAHESDKCMLSWLVRLTER